MHFSIAPMTRHDALRVLEWRYEPPYDFYNCVPIDRDDALAEMLDGSHLCARDDRGDPIGFFATGPTAQVPGGDTAGAYGDDALDVGLGLRPDLTGRGMGGEFVAKGFEAVEVAYKAHRLRLSVATWNKRAIRVYERIGFSRDTVFMSLQPGGETEFVSMTRQKAGDGR